MKNVLFIFAAFCFCFSADASDSDSESILSVFYQLQSLADTIVSRADYLDSTKQNLDNEVLKKSILDYLEPLATENFLKDWERRIDSCLALGWQLAYSGDFGWSLPATADLYFKSAFKNNPNKDDAEIICHGRTPDVFSMPESYFQDSDSCHPEIKNPWDKKYKLVKWRNEYRTKFSFKKTLSGWKLSGFDEEVVHLGLAGQ